MNVVVFASDSKSLSSLNSSIKELAKRGHRVFSMVTQHTQLQHPIYQKQNYTEEQITKALELNEELYTSVFYHLSSSIFSAVFIFGIIALISRWFVQKNKTLA